jgi:hypothetical protein
MFLPQLIGGLLQEKPDVPDFKPVNVQDAQTRAIRGNIASLPDLQSLASQVNEFSSDELLKQLNKLYPGYSELVQQTLGKTKEYLSGEIPKDVERQLRQYSAESATTTGTSGSSFASNQLLRTLGLTSLDMVSKGMDSASRWLAQANARTPVMDFTSMFINPAFQWQAETSERNSEFQRDWVSNQLDAKYSLGTIAGQALIKTDDQIMGIIASLAGSYSGMMTGGGGGGGGGGAYGGGSSYG